MGSIHKMIDEERNGFLKNQKIFSLLKIIFFKASIHVKHMRYYCFTNNYIYLQLLGRKMSGLLLRESNCAENEFLAEETLVEIIPNFDHPSFHFISGTFGPFETGVSIQIPLWFAISLNQKQKCKITIPEWLKVGYLEEKVRDEKSAPIFQDIHFHYIEVALMLFER